MFMLTYVCICITVNKIAVSFRNYTGNLEVQQTNAG